MTINRQTENANFQVCLPKLSLQSGHIIVIQGDSGCGKSTLLEMIGMILKPDNLNYYQLSITEQEMDIATLIKNNQQQRLAQIRARYLGFIPQTGGLLPFLTIKDNLLLPLQLLGKKQDKSRLQILTEKFDIAHLLGKYPKQLSIGERQRASFIRAIIHKPLLLLADEPTSALDPYNADRLFNQIIEQAHIDNIATLLITHEQRLAKQKNLAILAPSVKNKHQVIFMMHQSGSSND